MVLLFCFCILDKAMQLNHAKFRLNGGSGYVLKPDYMFDRIDTLSNTLTDDTLHVTVFIISGRHIGRSGHNGISNPFVTVEIHGSETDSGIKLKTRPISILKTVPGGKYDST